MHGCERRTERKWRCRASAGESWDKCVAGERGAQCAELGRFTPLITPNPNPHVQSKLLSRGWSYRALHIQMSSRIQSDLLLVDGAIRSSPSRALLKGGSVDAWSACNASLQAVWPVLRESALADRSGSEFGSASAAVSMHWRKSSASKKLLTLLRAVVEEAPALQGEAAHAAATRTIRCCAVHGSICVLNFFWQRMRMQHSATLWPAMREWIVELGGITSLWSALAWVVMIPKRDLKETDDDRGSVSSVLLLTHDLLTLPSVRRPVALTQNSAVTTVLSSVLGDLIPRDFAVGNAQAWAMHVVFYAITELYRLEGSMLAAHLHKPLLVFWPYLIADLRQQRRLRPDVAGASDASRTWLCGLKVHSRAQSFIHSL